MDGKLYEAAMNGNVSQLLDLLREDENTLDRLLFGGVVRGNPLHIAAQYGHCEFVKEILGRKLEFARKLDSQGRCPLHVASERGHLEVVKELLEGDADVCFVRDREGRTPLHIAAMRGRLLVRVRLTAAWVLTDQGDPILHFCVKHGQWDALKMLVERIHDNGFLKLKDGDDNTILHLVAAKAENKAVNKVLVDRLKTEGDFINSINVNGSTALDGKLYEAAMNGNVSQLLGLLQEDANILDRLLFGGVVRESPLHIAAQYGHSEFVKEISSRKLGFARKLDSQGRCPLHVASERGHLEVVKELLEGDADVCFVRDREGRTPLHIAVIRGRLKVLEELVKVRPTAAWVLTDQGDPILHFCVKHGQWDALKMLVERIHDNGFLKLNDRDDNTILHLVAAKAEYKDINKVLVDRLNPEEDFVNSMNVNGSTALDVAQGIRARCGRFKIKRTLKKAGAKKGKEISPTSRNRPKKRTSSKPQLEGSSNDSQSHDKIQDALMVVAILIATVTYGGVLSPPGGVWQDDKDGHYSGEAIMSSNYSELYILYTICNTLAFVVSLILILMLVSRSSFGPRVLKRYLTVMTWIAVTSLIVTYTLSFYTLCPEGLQERYLWIVVPVVVLGWLLIFCLLVLVFILRSLKSLIQKCQIKHMFDWMLSLLSRSRASEDQLASRLHTQAELQVVTS